MNHNIQIDATNASDVLKAFANQLDVDKFGVYTNGSNLCISAFSTNDNTVIPLLVHDHRQHCANNMKYIKLIDQFEFGLTENSEIFNAIDNSNITFKPFTFIDLNDVAYHLKIDLVDIETIVAKVLAHQAIYGNGIVIEEGFSNAKTLKFSSLEELFIMIDLAKNASHIEDNKRQFRELSFI